MGFHGKQSGLMDCDLMLAQFGRNWKTSSPGPSQCASHLLRDAFSQNATDGLRQLARSLAPQGAELGHSNCVFHGGPGVSGLMRTQRHQRDHPCYVDNGRQSGETFRVDSHLPQSYGTDRKLQGRSATGCLQSLVAVDVRRLCSLPAGVMDRGHTQ